LHGAQKRKWDFTVEQIPGCSATASTMKDAGVYVDDNGQGSESGYDS